VPALPHSTRATESDLAARTGSTPAPRDIVAQSTDVDRWLDMLRRAIYDTGWTHDALAVEMQVDKAYLSRMLSGEKPWTVKHLCNLPDDIEALFEQRRAESFGLIVVAPVDAETARRHLVSGLLGVLAPKPALPQKAGNPAKASLKGDRS
jgi:hypothetical protein